MAKVSTSISIDSEVKAKAQELFADFGMDLSTAINIFLIGMAVLTVTPFSCKIGANGYTKTDVFTSAVRYPSDCPERHSGYTAGNRWAVPAYSWSIAAGNP